MKTPAEDGPPVEAFKLRLTVRDEAVDTLLARLTDARTRQTLPSFLFIYSTQTYQHQVDTNYEHETEIDLNFRSYRRKLDNYNRHTFRAGKDVSLDGRLLRLQASLGLETTRQLLVPPFFEPTQETHLEMMYKVPGSEAIDKYVVDDLRAYVAEAPQKVFDELVIVSPETAIRSLYVRAKRNRPRDSEGIVDSYVAG